MPVDRWEFVGLTGAGEGYQYLGRGEGTSNSQFPYTIQVYNTGGNKSASFPGITFTIQDPEEPIMQRRPFWSESEMMG